ncbi:MAG TPA: tetratricopeptide repeat protein, partial [Gemmatimonadota bacterium]|nr:tetratricopeptide repeat protein [Gemmatimonadota bacterium]
GLWGDYAAAVEGLRARASAAPEQGGDSVRMRLTTGAMTALQGVGAWRRGRTTEARRLLEQARSSISGHFEAQLANQTIGWWMGELLVESGEPAEAIPYFVSLADGAAFITDPVAKHRLGKIYERLGDYAEAREAYEYFLTAWRDPDPALRPWAEEARQAVIRLTGPRRD